MTDEHSGPLDGLRVLDFGQYLAGPLVALLLAESGADVVRVDPPGGPRWQSPANALLQRSKRSVVLDLEAVADRDLARRLVDGADVVIEGFRPGVMARLGLDREEALARNPGLVWCSLPGFGSDDPRAQLPGWEGLVSSAAGLYLPGLFQITGEPRFSAVPMASTFAAAIAAHSILAALVGRARGAGGDIIEVPLWDAAFDAIGIYGEAPGTLAQAGMGHTQERIANPAFGTESPYRCRDGRWIGNCGSPPRGLHAFWDAHLPPELKDRTDDAAVEQARGLLSALFGSRDAVDWERTLQEEHGAAVAAAQTSAQWLRDDHALASGSVVQVEDPVLGPTAQAGAVLRLRGTAHGVRWPRRPLGADTEAVRREVAAAGVPAPRPSAPRAAPALPLAGMRVLDITNLLAGPIGARVLAEYGADVIKINKAAIGLGRPDPRTDDPITFIGHRTTGTGKRTTYLDLRSEQGRALLDELVATADVVHTNCPPDVARRLGLDEQRLRGIRPDVVWSSTRLHAGGGWRESYRGHEDLAEHVTGMSLRFGGGVPDRMHGIIVNDHATGHFAAFGVLLALLARLRTGRGAAVETSLSQTCGYLQVPYMVGWAGAREDEPSGPDATGWGEADRLVLAADGWLWVAAGDGGPAALRAVPGLAGADLDAAFATRPVAEWLPLLAAAGVAAHPYRTIAEVMEDPIAIARGLSVTREHPGLGVGREVGTLDRFASRRGYAPAAAAAPGWHTAELLAELGRADELDDLVARGVVATHETRDTPAAR